MLHDVLVSGQRLSTQAHGQANGDEFLLFLTETAFFKFTKDKLATGQFLYSEVTQSLSLSRL